MTLAAGLGIIIIYFLCESEVPGLLNILFSFFLFGMLITTAIRVYRRAVIEEQPITQQQLALLLALAIGSLIALHRGAYSIYKVPLLEFF